MIFYATAKTMQLYNLKPPDRLSPASIPLAAELLARETGDRLKEWCVKQVYFAGKRCIVMMNHATRFTLFLYDISAHDMDCLSEIMAIHLFELFAGDDEMLHCLHAMLSENKYCVFAPAQDRSAIAALNHIYKDACSNGARFQSYVDYRNVLHTRQINYDMNFKWLQGLKADGTRDSIAAGPLFKQMVLDRYRKQQS